MARSNSAERSLTGRPLSTASSSTANYNNKREADSPANMPPTPIEHLSPSPPPESSIEYSDDDKDEVPRKKSPPPTSHPQISTETMDEVNLDEGRHTISTCRFSKICKTLVTESSCPRSTRVLAGASALFNFRRTHPLMLCRSQKVARALSQVDPRVRPTKDCRRANDTGHCPKTSCSTFTAAPTAR